ncbi:hypothetical protein [Streptomyces indicus]|uniref:Uncharacterized protein n=1 Tax=Streptomyces indicus TaxID=417292 RepID=A0A1G9FL55_9ACTN|nr:hypothetical protein [Streptomyces indicus]SDK89099.1 hypothetical protein SAMN05421806_113202 [Streptomyces indicus]
MRAMTLDKLTALARRLSDVPLPLPDGMRTQLGCDAVGMPAELGRQAMTRMSRVGCVYATGDRWWWIVPSHSEQSLDWPEPVQYAPRALVPPSASGARLIHHPGRDAPYTPPIPLYLTLCRITRTVPVWMRPAEA